MNSHRISSRTVRIVLLALSLALASALAGCASTEAPSDGPGVVTLTIGASPTPHAEILAVVADVLAEQGIELEVTQYDDYVIPNTAVEDGDLDANFFQHVPYLDDFNAENGTHLVDVAAVHFEPLAIYGGRAGSLDALTEGSKVAVPNDATNEARALLLLEQEGLIDLADDAGIAATVRDIVDNPLGLEFVEVEAAAVPRQLADVDIAVVNGNYALDAGLDPADALAREDADGVAARTYANVLVVKEGSENDDAVKALIAALTSDRVREFIDATWPGAVVPVF